MLKEELQKTEKKYARQFDGAISHRLIKKLIDKLHVGQKSYTQENIFPGRCEHLATNKETPDFYLKLLQVKDDVAVIYLICLDSSIEVEPLTTWKIESSIVSSSGKSLDVYDVTAEHENYGCLDTWDFVKQLLN